MRWTPAVLRTTLTTVKVARNITLSALVAAASFLGVVFVLVSTSIIQDFRIYPRDSDGGFALFLIELVCAFLASSVAGLLCLQRLLSGCSHQNDHSGIDGAATPH